MAGIPTFYYIGLSVWAVIVAFLVLIPLRRVAADRAAFHRLLLTLLPALVMAAAGFGLAPTHENLGFSLIGLGFLLYGFNWLANRVLWARALTAWFGRLISLYRTESSARVVVVILGAIAMVFGVGMMVAIAIGER